jgi:transposase
VIVANVRELRAISHSDRKSDHILRPRGKDSSLRQWGLHLASRGGKQARNKAVVVVARNLAVLLHRIWITQEPYVPFYTKVA